MEITWFGISCFRLKGREGVVLMDPPEKASGLSIGKQQNIDLVTISHAHPGHGNREAAPGATILDSPGEFEVSSILVGGIRTCHDNKRGEERGKNVAFTVELEGIRVCHLGDIGHIPTADEVEELGQIHVLLVPVGGGTTVDGAQAAAIVALLEPRAVIPMHYRLQGGREDLAPIDRFLKEMGATNIQPQPKVNYSRSSLPAEPHVEVLEPRF
ncbi:MAG: lactamase [Dehalococcoidia bacterium]|nr:lactamase [Dehalococcoidia bacterium]